MTESTQYAKEGTEYSSNMSSDVTEGENEGENMRGFRQDNALQVLECSGEHRRSVMSTGCSTDGVSMLRRMKAASRACS